MNDSLIRKVCESPKRGLIVAIVTILVAVVVLTPLVDEYLHRRNEYAVLEEQLDTARLTAQSLPSLEKSHDEIQAKLSALEERCVSEATISGYRTRLVEMVRDGGCQLRTLNFANPRYRAWKEKDSPLEDKSLAAGKDTPFSLETRVVSLSVTGGAQNIYDFLGALQRDPTLAYPERVEIRAEGQGGELLGLDLDMKLFALTKLK